MAADFNPMQVRWGDHDRAVWDAAHTAAAGALQQDWAYGAAMESLQVPVLRARIERDAEPVALAQLIVRRFGRLGAVALCSRGPLWLRPLAAADKALAYRALKRTLPLRGLRFLLVTPEEAAGAPNGLSPLRRVITGMSTVMIDLTQAPDLLRAGLEHRWRNRLVGGERSGLSVQRIGAHPAQLRWLIDAELAQRQQKRLSGLPAPFFDSYLQARTPAPPAMLALRADAGRERVAAMLFLLHGAAATYEIGWSGERGRELHAHNLLLWQAIAELQARGVRRLDLGGVNTERSAGLARFKLGTGGAVLTLAGTYLV